MQTRPDGTEPRRWARARRAAPLVLALAPVAIAAACGGPPPASVANLGSTTSTTIAPASRGGAGRGGGGGDAGAGSPSSSPSSSSGSSSSTIGIGGITLAFSKCMRSHGVPEFPDPDSQGAVQFSGVDPTSPQFVAAQKACAKYGDGGGSPASPAQQQKALAAALKYSQCMRSHGISDFPDPTAQAGGGIAIRIDAGRNSDLNPNSPLFRTAQKACQSLGPGGGKLTSGSGGVAAG